MPTLIRLVVVLAVLAGFGYAGMIALTIMVDPGERDVTIRIPARMLSPSGGAPGAIDLNNLPDPVNLVSRESSELPPEISSSPPDENGVRTVTIPE